MPNTLLTPEEMAKRLSQIIKEAYDEDPELVRIWFERVTDTLMSMDMKGKPTI